MPDGTPLEQTTAAAQALGRYLGGQPELTNYQIYSGTSGPYNFNGLVRHYFLRSQPNQADIQVNLLSRHERSAQSHDIARRLRPGLDKIAESFNAHIKVAEVPPGPPELQTLVAEVYGPDYKGQIEVAARIKKLFQQTPGVVDVDWYVEDPQTKYDMKVDLDKAALHGISPADVNRTLQVALGGAEAGLLHDPKSREDIPIEVRLARSDRSRIEDLANLKLPTASGSQIALQELTNLQQSTIDTSVYRKNLQPVVYVTGDVAGGKESPVYAIMKMSDSIDKLKLPDGYAIKQYKGTTMPGLTDRYSMKWDGEWHITVEVFRDLGLAFAAGLVLIYVLVVGWFRSFIAPLVIMAPIPLTLVGILPAHALMGAFFTATSMIGFIAGAGIIVRNSIILVDFIELRRSQGMPLEDAVVDSGAVRFRAHTADRCCGRCWSKRDPLRSYFSGIGIVANGGRGRFDCSLPHGCAVPVLPGGEKKDRSTFSSTPAGKPRRVRNTTMRSSTERVNSLRRLDMTIERALRLIAGAFVLVSLALGHCVSPYWYLFTAFVGLNLLQSGFSNWCPMMAILRKLGVGNRDKLTHA